MEGIGKAIEGEVSKSFSSSTQDLEVKMREGTKAAETLSKEPSKGKRSAELPPGLASGRPNRRLWVGTKSEQPPGTANGQKMEFRH